MASAGSAAAREAGASAIVRESVRDASARGALALPVVRGRLVVLRAQAVAEPVLGDLGIDVDVGQRAAALAVEQRGGERAKIEAGRLRPREQRLLFLADVLVDPVGELGQRVAIAGISRIEAVERRNEVEGDRMYQATCNWIAAHPMQAVLGALVVGSLYGRVRS